MFCHFIWNVFLICACQINLRQIKKYFVSSNKAKGILKICIARLTVQEQDLRMQPEKSGCKDIVAFLPVTVKSVSTDQRYAMKTACEYTGESVNI